MSELRVYLFGSFRIQRDDRHVNGFDAGKAQELLSFLLLHRERSYHREFLAELLWPEGSAGQNRKALRQAIWQLQSALDSATASSAERVLVLESDQVTVSSEANIWCDIVAFEHICALTRDVSPVDINADLARHLEDAVQLYRGDVLEGWYQDWCMHERERLQNSYLQLLNKLMVYCECVGAYERGMVHGTRILEYERAHERTHRQLMRLHLLAGDRTGAIRQYQRCVEALREELDVEPSRRTVQLFEQIQFDDLMPAGSESPVARVARLAPLSEQLEGVRQLLLKVAGVQRELQLSIEAIELTLKARH